LIYLKRILREMNTFCNQMVASGDFSWEAEGVENKIGWRMRAWGGGVVRRGVGTVIHSKPNCEKI
jgi:hypothetical protein